LLDPELYRSNPHDLWTWMRANEPVYRDDRNGLWGITRHADVLTVERRDDVFRSGLGYRAIWSPEEVNMIAQDDPQHLTQRRLVNRRFTPRAVREHEDEFRALVTELLDNVMDAGEMEVVDALAAQLPARLTCRLLGFPEDRWRDLKSWSERLMRTDMRDRSGETFIDFVTANQEFVDLVQQTAMGGCPADSLLDTWLTAEIDGARLDPKQVIHETGLFIAGGAETTRTVIAHGLRAFCDHPDQWTLLRDRPELVPSAVEEMIRWVTPLNNFFRRAVAPFQLGDTMIAPGDRVILLYPSANRDEDIFADPFRFDITRDPNPHVAFGHGTHFCLGANFARHELRVLLEEMTSRITALRALSEPDVEPNIFARAVRSFRLGFSQIETLRRGQPEQLAR
jgi:cholest-4-en-3-one 26-monooxygenase